jgi:hypothetical protein
MSQHCFAQSRLRLLPVFHLSPEGAYRYRPSSRHASRPYRIRCCYDTPTLGLAPRHVITFIVVCRFREYAIAAEECCVRRSPAFHIAALVGIEAACHRRLPFFVTLPSVVLSSPGYRRRHVAIQLR